MYNTTHILRDGFYAHNDNYECLTIFRAVALLVHLCVPARTPFIICRLTNVDPATIEHGLKRASFVRFYICTPHI